MHRGWAAVILIALASAEAPAAPPAADVFDAVAACIARLDPEIDVGFERIAARCPGIAHRLQASDWAAWLPPGWQDDHGNLTARSLAALRPVVAGELVLRTSTRTPQVALVQPILADLAARNPPPGGWWEAMRSWLRSLFAPAPKGGANAFEKLLSRVALPQALLWFVAYATLALVVLLAGFIVANEWRAYAPGRGRSSTPRACGQAHAAKMPLTWHDVEGASFEERPRMLLELIAARLTAARRLPTSAAFTVRELARAAELADAADRDSLDEVAAAAERLCFAVQAPSAASIAQALKRGRELLDRLREPVAARVSEGGLS